VELTLNRYLQSVIQKEIRSSIETYLRMDVISMRLNKVSRLQIKLGDLSMNR